MAATSSPITAPMAPDSMVALLTLDDSSSTPGDDEIVAPMAVLVADVAILLWGFETTDVIEFVGWGKYCGELEDIVNVIVLSVA